MPKNPIEIHPTKISSIGFQSEGFFKVILPISSESKITTSDTLAICLTVEQAKDLHKVLGDQINFLMKDRD